jgi:hypothetical protein
MISDAAAILCSEEFQSIPTAKNFPIILASSHLVVFALRPVLINQDRRGIECMLAAGSTENLRNRDISPLKQPGCETIVAFKPPPSPALRRIGQENHHLSIRTTWR